MRVLVTGAAGFVGRAVCASLAERGLQVTAAVRDAAAVGSLPGADVVLGIGDMTSASVDWSAALAQVEVVVHLAARVHVMNDRAADLDAVYRRANVDATTRLARAAIDTGARRLVYVSSVKAVAERSAGTALRETDRAAPEDAYGRSKRDAEQALAALGVEQGFETVIIRPPLVYGPGVRGNFPRLMSLVRLSTRVPLPLGDARGLRSFVFVRNLADAIACAATHADAVGQTFYVRDGEDLTTAELIRRLGAAVDRHPRLLPVPAGLVRAAAGALGRRAEVERIFGALQLDDTHIRQRLGWRPPVSVDAALAETARALVAGMRPGDP
jgi:UDP-glucose 4-epimerase